MRIRMTDDQGHFWMDGKLYKLKGWIASPREEAMKGIHQATFVEVNPEEYDNRVETLAKRIASFPKVDLLDMVRDALYDMPLDQLHRLEVKLTKEVTVAEEKSIEPRVETRRGERGTCVELRVGGRFGANLRV